MDVLNFTAIVESVSPGCTTYSSLCTAMACVGGGGGVAVAGALVDVGVAAGAVGVNDSAVGMAAIVAAMRVCRLRNSGVGSGVADAQPISTSDVMQTKMIRRFMAIQSMTVPFKTL